MNINSLLTTTGSGLSGYGTSTPSSQGSRVTSPVTQALAKANRRIQSEVDSAKAQLSSFGLLKSAVSSGQLAAQALTKLPATASESDITKTTAAFFNAYNNTISASKATTAIAGTSPASQGATRINRDMRTAMTSDMTTRDALKKLGLSVQSDGTLAHDAPKFANALKSDPAGVRAALEKLGKSVNAAASKELASDGIVGDALAKLNARNTALSAQQKALKAAYQPTT